MRRAKECTALLGWMWGVVWTLQGCVTFGRGPLRIPAGGYAFDACQMPQPATKSLSLSQVLKGEVNKATAARVDVVHFGSQSYARMQVYELAQGTCVGSPSFEVWLEREHRVAPVTELPEFLPVATTTTVRIVRPLDDKTAALFTQDERCQRFPGETWPIGEARNLIDVPQCLSALQQKVALGDARAWHADEGGGYCLDDPDALGEMAICFKPQVAAIGLRGELQNIVVKAEEARTQAQAMATRMNDDAAERQRRQAAEASRRIYESSPEYKEDMRKKCWDEKRESACWAISDYVGLCAAGEEAACKFGEASNAYEQRCLVTGDLSQQDPGEHLLTILIVKKLGGRRYSGIAAGKSVQLQIQQSVTEPSNVGTYQVQLGQGIRSKGVRKVRQDSGFDEEVLDLVIGDKTCSENLDAYKLAMEALRKAQDEQRRRQALAH